VKKGAFRGLKVVPKKVKAMPPQIIRCNFIDTDGVTCGQNLASLVATVLVKETWCMIPYTTNLFCVIFLLCVNFNLFCVFFLFCVRFILFCVIILFCVRMPLLVEIAVVKSDAE
jgi:hypothetical protein